MNQKLKLNLGQTLNLGHSAMILFLIILALPCCGKKQIQQKEDFSGIDNITKMDSAYYKLFIGVSKNIVENKKGNFKKKILFFLNNSMEDSIRQSLKKNFSTFKYGTYTGYSLNEKDPVDIYISYRINEYIGDLGYSGTNHGLIGNEIEGDTLFNELIEMESFYMQAAKEEGKVDYIKQGISLINEVHLKHKENLRLKYLMANLYLSIQDYDQAISMYDSLININYYKYKSLLRLTECYQKQNNFDKVSETNNRIRLEYPSLCNINVVQGKKYDQVNYEKECQNCLQRGAEREQIITRIFFCEYLLKNNEVATVKKYFKNIELIYNGDMLKLWELSHYYDLSMRLLFKEKKHEQICEFVNEKVKLNSLLNIKNTSELEQLLLKYNSEYKLYSEPEFESLFSKYYENCFYDRSYPRRPRLGSTKKNM